MQELAPVLGDRPHGCSKFLKWSLNFVNLEQPSWPCATGQPRAARLPRQNITVCFIKNIAYSLAMSARTPRRSKRIRDRDEEKLARSSTLKSKLKVANRSRRPKNVVLASSSEEEEVSSFSEEDDEVDPSDLISPVTKQRKPNNFLKV